MIELSLADLIQIVILAVMAGGIIVTVRANTKRVGELVTKFEEHSEHLIPDAEFRGRIEGRLGIAGGSNGEEH